MTRSFIRNGLLNKFCMSIRIALMLDGFYFVHDLWDGVIVVKVVSSESDLKAYRDAGAEGVSINERPLL